MFILPVSNLPVTCYLCFMKWNFDNLPVTRYLLPAGNLPMFCEIGFGNLPATHR